MFSAVLCTFVTESFTSEFHSVKDSPGLYVFGSYTEYDRRTTVNTQLTLYGEPSLWVSLNYDQISSSRFSHHDLVVGITVSPYTIFTFNGPGWGLDELLFDTPTSGRQTKLLVGVH